VGTFTATIALPGVRPLEELPVSQGVDESTDQATIEPSLVVIASGCAAVVEPAEAVKVKLLWDSARLVLTCWNPVTVTLLNWIG
jgi:hypothetical protein